jgi:hypothetical protein
MEPSDGATIADQIARVPVITDADVLARVGQVIEPAARRERAVWLFFFYSDGTQAPVVVPIGDMPEMPADDDAEVTFHVLRHFYGLGSYDDGTDDDLSFVITVCRDGPLAEAESDRQWLRVLQHAIGEYAAPVRMICLATPEGIRSLGPAY